jgi:hypothetical protein
LRVSFTLAGRYSPDLDAFGNKSPDRVFLLPRSENELRIPAHVPAVVGFQPFVDTVSARGAV